MCWTGTGNCSLHQPNINSMLNRLSFFKPMRPNLLQIGQTRYQSTPLYLYIHNIKLVCKSGTLCAGLEREIVVYTLPNINSMLNRLSFFKPMRPKLLQAGQTRYQSTPFYLYIHNIKLVCKSGTLCAGLEREIVVYTNRISTRWSIALAFSNLRDQNYFK